MLRMKQKKIVLLISLSIFILSSNAQECLLTIQGLEYKGTMSTSETGKTCLRWDTNDPTIAAYQANEWFPDGSFSAANNYCRNLYFTAPTNQASDIKPWCFVAGPTIERCNVPMCPRETRTRLGIEYRGNVATTYTGKTCQPWNSQSPHSHPYNAGNWPVQGETITESSNFCRNPNNAEYGLWCYTTDTNTVWEVCMVPTTTTDKCVNNTVPWTYAFFDGVSQFGRTCLAWNSIPISWYNSSSSPSAPDAVFTSENDLVVPPFHPSLLPDTNLNEPVNYCRNPDNDKRGAWCYISLNGKIQKDYCRTPCTGVWTCLFERTGTYYQGIVAETKVGVPCQAWTAKVPVDHNMDTVGVFPNGETAAEASNYCRNPDNNLWGPWCYKSGDIRSGIDTWDYCNIPVCDGSTTPTLTTVASSDECIKDAYGLDYAGKKNTAVVGGVTRDCQPWKDTTPINHPYNAAYMLNAVTMDDAANYCRNPSASATGPWCYPLGCAISPVSCNIPRCVDNLSTTTETTTTTSSITSTGTSDPSSSNMTVANSAAFLVAGPFGAVIAFFLPVFAVITSSVIYVV